MKSKELIIETWTLVMSERDVEGQQLVVFPDLRTMEQYNSFMWDGVVVLHSKSTKKQKSEAFWWIKQGNIKNLFCTYSQIFQDRHHLTSIIMIDQHKRYYKHHQDPRYTVGTVLEKMADIYGARLEKMGIEELEVNNK